MIRTVVWDVDDVLNDLMRSWLNVWNRSRPGQTVSYDHLRENPPHEILGVTSSEYLASLDAFRLSEAYRGEVPDSSILTWLQAHGSECRHMALTATTLEAAPASSAWVFRHFGRWIREFGVLPAARPGADVPVYDSDKGAWIGRLRGPVVLVDDSPENVAAVQARGAAALSWPRPWNDARLTVAETLGALTRFVRDGVVP